MSAPSVDLPVSELRVRAERLLRDLVGAHARLRDDQWAAIEALVVDRRRALVVQRTGWGKSAVYFVATGLLRAAGAGPTLIVSPLLALMRNQVAAAVRAGIRAASVNSANPEEWVAVSAAVARGDVDVLLISPERLTNPDFRATVLPTLVATAGLLVVDEAHCISDWGHDFRPDYRRITDLLGAMPDGSPVLATTATANRRVVDDVTAVLGLGGSRTSPGGTVFVQRGSLDRESLHLGVLYLPSTAHRLGWLADHLGDLPGSGIVYTLTVADAAEVTDFLRSHDFPVAAYTGQTDPAERMAAEDDLLHNRVKALVATSALGMGYDKPDLGFVVHFGAPPSPIAYYQQVGRAGRGVDRATVLLLPGVDDQAVWDYYAQVGFPDEAPVRATLAALSASSTPLSTPALESRVPLSRSRLELMLKIVAVDGAVARVKGGWVATGAPWHYDRDRYTRLTAVRHAEQQAMRRYLTTRSCRMRFLREELDDPSPRDCGRCDNCGGLTVPTTVAPAASDRAAERLARPGVPLLPRRLWPAGMASLGVDVSGRIPASRMAVEGRAVARLTGLGYGPRLRDLLGVDSPDQEIPADLFAAAVRVLAAWEWPTRPAAVVSVGSTRRPRLVGGFAQRIAEVGRLPYCGAVTHTGPPAASRANSAHRLRAVWDAYRLPADLAAELGGPLRDCPLLLVDDMVDTGWTVTVVAGMLRAAGAGLVLPLALAQAG